MPLLKPDPTFYPSPRLAAEAPPEKLAFVAALNPPGGKNNDAILVVDVDPESAQFGQEVGTLHLARVWGRTASFRLERMQFGALSVCAASACGTALPHRPGNSFVAHLRDRYQTRPA